MRSPKNRRQFITRSATMIGAVAVGFPEGVAPAGAVPSQAERIPEVVLVLGAKVKAGKCNLILLGTEFSQSYTPCECCRPEPNSGHKPGDPKAKHNQYSLAIAVDGGSWIVEGAMRVNVELKVDGLKCDVQGLRISATAPQILPVPPKKGAATGAGAGDTTVTVTNMEQGTPLRITLANISYVNSLEQRGN